MIKLLNNTHMSLLLRLLRGRVGCVLVSGGRSVHLSLILICNVTGRPRALSLSCYKFLSSGYSPSETTVQTESFPVEGGKESGSHNPLGSAQMEPISRAYVGRARTPVVTYSGQ